MGYAAPEKTSKSKKGKKDDIQNLDDSDEDGEEDGDEEGGVEEEAEEEDPVTSSEEEDPGPEPEEKESSSSSSSSESEEIDAGIGPQLPPGVAGPQMAENSSKSEDSDDELKKEIDVKMEDVKKEE